MDLDLMNISTDSDVVSKFKVYKEKEYANSDGDPFGCSLRGKTKEYIEAHELIKKLMKTGQSNFCT